jgi:hypothetical protein
MNVDPVSIPLIILLCLPGYFSLQYGPVNEQIDPYVQTNTQR